MKKSEVWVVEFSRQPFVWGTICGFFLSMLMAGCIVVVAAKVGISPAVSPLVVLIGWVAFYKMFPNQLRDFLGPLQVAGSGGVAVASGLVFSAPIIQVLTEKLTGTPVDVDIAQLLLATLSGSLIGWGFMGLTTSRLLKDPTLPAPEAVACDRLIKTAAADPQSRPNINISMIPGLILGGGISALTHFNVLVKKIWALNIAGASFPLYLGPIYIGIGALVTFPTALMMFFGGTVNASVGAYAAAHGLPATTVRWVGGSAMFVAVIFSLINYYVEERKKASGKISMDDPDLDESLLKVKPSESRNAKIGIVAGYVLLIALMFTLNITFIQVVALSVAGIILGYLLSSLGGLLSLQVGSAASPVSGVVFVGLLCFSLVGFVVGLGGPEGAMVLVPMTVSILVAIACANDAAQDYKTVYLNGFVVSRSHICQLIGLIAAAITAPFVLAMIHKTQVLGSAALPVPQAKFFGTVLQSLFMSEEIPVGPIIFGSCLGVVTVIMQIIGRKKGILLSAMALTVGIYLPAAIGTMALIGNLAKSIGGKSLNAKGHQGILITAGFITGDALFGLLVSLMILSGVSPASFETPLHAGFSLLALLIVLGGIFYNYSIKTKTEM